MLENGEILQWIAVDQEQIGLLVKTVAFARLRFDRRAGRIALGYRRAVSVGAST